MARTLLRQSQINNSSVDVIGYEDNLVVQLDAANTPETTTGTSLIAAEAATFGITSSIITFSVTNPQTAGVVPGDDLTIAGSTSDDGTYIITAVSSGTVTIDYTTTAADGGSATGAIAAVRNDLTDMNYIRAQLRRLANATTWHGSIVATDHPLLEGKKVVYTTESNTNIAIPAAANADISSLGLTYADESGTAEGALASTSTPTAGGSRKSEGGHSADIVDAATGEPITVSGHRAYGYIVVDNIAVPTSELIYFVYFDNSTDAEVLISNLSTEQDGSATNFEVIYRTRSNLADIPEDFGLTPVVEEAFQDTSGTLQQAYNAGETITLIDTEGDLIITLDDSGTAADFAIADGGGDYIRTDAANNTLDLGSAANQVDINASTAVTGANTFDVGTGQAIFAGNVDANAGLDVTGVTNLGDGGTTNYAQFSATGDLDFVGSADTISKSDAALIIQAISDNLTLQTITSGILALQSAGAMDIDSTGALDILSASTFSIDGTGASNVSATSGNLNLQTLTSGNVAIDAAGDILFADSTWAGGTDPLPFSDAGNTAFTGTAAGAISLIDAINQTAVATGENMDQGDSTPGATARDTDITIPGGLAYTLAADFVTDFLIFVNGVKMRNGVNAAANYDVYPGTLTTDIRFEFKIKAGDVVSAMKIA